VILFLLLIVLVLIGLTAAAVMGKIGGSSSMAEAVTTRSFRGLPAGPLSAVALAELQFDQALRGYRMDQVDEVIDALSTRVRELESQVAPFEPEVAPLEPEVAPLEERRQE
jgi:DivIVA domain-containing protein